MARATVAASFQKLVNAFVAARGGNGGELILNTTVGRVVIEKGRAAGVVFGDGTHIRAPVVVSNADAAQTFEQLVGAEHLPDRFMKRLRAMTPAISAFTVYAATTMDLRQLGLAHEIFLSTCWDPDETWQKLLCGEPAELSIASPTLADPSLAPPGEQLLSVVAPMPYHGVAWSERKDEYVKRILGEIEELIPGIRDSLTFIEGATPMALERYSLNKDGALYGWENTPAQTLTKRLSNRTPIDGLYLSGAWTQPGSGTIGVMQSGFQTAQAIAGYADQGTFLDALGYTGPPSERLRGQQDDVSRQRPATVSESTSTTTS